MAPFLFLFVVGRDHDTAEGTCIRDYVHVADLADAHWRALTYLLEGGTTTAFNLSNGMGFSVAEVIATAARVTQRRIPVVDAPRRAGDPARLVADARRAQTVLGWQPRYTDLASLIAHAWAWECRAG